MVLKRLVNKNNFSFLGASSGVKKDVSIYTRKQFGQKGEGFSASKF